MSNTGISVDTSGILRVFSSLGVGEMQKVHRAALAKSAGVLLKETRMLLKGVTGRASSTRTADRRGWSKIKGKGRIGKLTDGVRMYVSRDVDFAKVHIMKDFRLKFFEMGTGPRKTREGYNRGQMPVRSFFSPAISMSRDKMAQVMSKTITDAVTKRCKQ